jgi:hypothetical protein
MAAAPISLGIVNNLKQFARVALYAIHQSGAKKSGGPNQTAEIGGAAILKITVLIKTVIPAGVFPTRRSCSPFIIKSSGLPQVVPSSAKACLSAIWRHRHGRLGTEDPAAMAGDATC